MRDLGYVATVGAVQVPTVLVLLVGLVLTATAGRRLPRRPRLLALFGLGVLLVTSVLNLAWVVLLPRLIHADFGWSEFQAVSTTYSGVVALAYPVGTGLLIAAVLAGRRATGATAGPSGGWPPGPPAPPLAGPPAPPAGPPVPSPAGWAADAPAGPPAQWGGRTRPDGADEAARP
ncbi:hypothetical protein GA0070606_4353 [Micromonospora citrea]|uniref:Uncharacterized protein n=1 Tax=Micromonospora citrea TaxID=47855 RepID=A0A1C6VJV6_9ACTN|nr:hypothetical protein [Micromonospora citrea]SCL66552.1 hypothetical protein GA0070606_4353 [Micromonospora citrea]